MLIICEVFFINKKKLNMVRVIFCNFCDLFNFGSEVDMVIYDVRKDVFGKKVFNLVVLLIKI